MLYRILLCCLCITSAFSAEQVALKTPIISKETIIGTNVGIRPFRKTGVPDDIANAVLFLASDESKYITGIELTIDGGLLAGAGAPVAKQETSQ